MVASVPDSNGVINGCYRTNGGDLRVRDTAINTDTCSNKETAISWGQGNAGVNRLVHSSVDSLGAPAGKTLFDIPGYGTINTATSCNNQTTIQFSFHNTSAQDIFIGGSHQIVATGETVTLESSGQGQHQFLLTAGTGTQARVAAVDFNLDDYTQDNCYYMGAVIY